MRRVLTCFSQIARKEADANETAMNLRAALNDAEDKLNDKDRELQMFRLSNMHVFFCDISVC